MTRRIPCVAALAVLAGACADVPTRTEQPVGAPPSILSQLGTTSLTTRDRYIVMLRADATDVRGVARRLTSAPGARMGDVYEHAIRGFSATLPPALVEAVRRAPEVESVSPVEIMRLSGTTTPAPWHLDRVDQRDLPLNNVYHYKATGRGVNIYVVDTGIYTAHPEFGGRARIAVDVFGGDGQDCNGHGTHVAGIAGGATYGVAKEATVHAVRVFSCEGYTTSEAVMRGLNWLTANRQLPAVANLSFEGGPNDEIDAAVRGLVASGVTVVIAAGNRASPDVPADACTVTPARVAEAITVSASTESDARASFANYGSCVDIFAPGVNVRSADVFDPDKPPTDPGDDECVNRHGRDGAICVTRMSAAAVQPTNDVRSGTSMAAPHVAGVAALHLQDHPTETPAAVTSAILSNATPDKVINEWWGSPRTLLYSGFVTRRYHIIRSYVTASRFGVPLYHYVDPVNGGGGAVTAEATSTTGMGAHLFLIDLNGGTLNSGDQVALRNHSESYYISYSSNYEYLAATSTTLCDACKFVVQRVEKVNGVWRPVIGKVSYGTTGYVAFSRPGAKEYWFVEDNWWITASTALYDRTAWSLAILEE